MRRNWRRNWRRALVAFTLIEVTMVAGIIGGAQGSYSGALDRAKRAKCQHNLRQIYQGLLITELTEGGRLPRISFYSKDPKKDPHGLLRVLGPSYAGVLVCPTVPEDIKKKGVSYVFNDEVSGKSLGAVRRASRTWLVMGMTAVVRDKKNPKELAGQQPHSGGVNVLYADGHIEWTRTPPVLVEPDKRTKEGEPPAGEPEGEPAPTSPPVRLPRIPSLPRPM